MRSRILLSIGAATTLVIVAFLVPLWSFVGDFAVDRAQRQAVLQVQPLVQSVAVDSPATVEPVIQSFQQRTGYATTVYYPDGTTIGADVPAGPEVELAAKGGAFFSDVAAGRDLLVPVRGANGTAVIRATIPTEVLYANVTSSRLLLIGLAIVLLSLALGLGLLLARSFLRPIANLADTASTLASGDLDARATPGGPKEIQAVGRQLNRLAGRVEELLRVEREQVADIAHRLRTPVTALRLDADSLADEAERQRLGGSVDRLAVVVDQVIREARRPVREGMAASSDVCAIVRERVTFWSVLAEDQARTTWIRIPAGPIMVRLDASDLAEAIDALLQNIFAHTEEGTAYSVTVVLGDTTATVVVEDAGLGFEADAIVRGESGAGSTGLGLDISRRSAEASGGHLTIEHSSAGGAKVEMVLGRLLD